MWRLNCKSLGFVVICILYLFYKATTDIFLLFEKEKGIVIDKLVFK